MISLSGILGVRCATLNEKGVWSNSVGVVVSGEKYFVPPCRMGFIQADKSGIGSSQPYPRGVFIHAISENRENYLIGFNDELSQWIKVWVNKNDLVYKLS